MQRRRGPPAQAASVKITARQALTNEEAEQFLTAYLPNSGSNDTLKNQLTRVQRDLRGLPPLVRSTPAPETPSGNIDADDDEQMAYAEEADEKQISKEERKRLKKERRKSEKQQKALANSAAAE